MVMQLDDILSYVSRSNTTLAVYLAAHDLLIKPDQIQMCNEANDIISHVAVQLRDYLRCGIPSRASLCPYQQHTGDTNQREQVHYAVETPCCTAGGKYRYLV